MSSLFSVKSTPHEAAAVVVVVVLVLVLVLLFFLSLSLSLSHYFSLFAYVSIYCPINFWLSLSLSLSFRFLSISPNLHGDLFLRIAA